MRVLSCMGVVFFFVVLFFFFFKKKRAYEIWYGLVGSERCIRDRHEGCRRGERSGPGGRAGKAKVLEQARREAQEIRAQATRDAEKIAQDVRGRAEQEATDIRMKAQADAAKQGELALADANKQIAGLAILATEKLLGRELGNKSEQQRFVADFLAESGSKGK